MSNTAGTAKLGNFIIVGSPVEGDTRIRYTIRHSSGTVKMDQRTSPQDLTEVLRTMVELVADAKRSDPRNVFPKSIQKSCPKMLADALEIFFDAQAAVSA